MEYIHTPAGVTAGEPGQVYSRHRPRHESIAPAARQPAPPLSVGGSGRIFGRSPAPGSHRRQAASRPAPPGLS